MKPFEEKLMRQHWESEASEYVHERKWSSVDTKVLESLNPEEGEFILEIGFGSCITAAGIRRTFPDVFYFGVDFAEKFLQIARITLDDSAVLLKASASYLPFKNESFHHILEMDAIHHFPKNIIPGVVEKIAGLLKTGGQLMVVEDWAAPPVDEREKLAHAIQRRRHFSNSGMEYHPSEAEWISMFRNARLKIDRREHVDRPLNFGRFEEINDPAALEELAKLRVLWGQEDATTKMTFFICKKV